MVLGAVFAISNVEWHLGDLHPHRPGVLGRKAWTWQWLAVATEQPSAGPLAQPRRRCIEQAFNRASADEDARWRLHSSRLGPALPSQ